MKNSKVRLDSQEVKIEKALEKEEFESVDKLQETKTMFKKAAKNYKEMTKTKKITIRVNNEDLIKIKARAKRNNIPYQTLLKTLIRQFVQGKTGIQL